MNYKIGEAIKHGLGDSYMHKVDKVEEKHWSIGRYNIDFPDINDIKDYFYDEYYLYQAIENNEEPTEIIKVDKKHPLCVSKTHLWAMLSNKDHKGRYYIYRGYKIFEKDLKEGVSLTVRIQFKSVWEMREIIHLQVGQCGNQVFNLDGR